jgi:imidazolonepropionase
MDNAPGMADEVIDAKGRFVLPGFCDSHTHLVFATGREDEFAMRIAGKTYEEIAAAGGGILNSVAKLREMSEDALFESAVGRLATLHAMGTCAIEIKSGYGLSLDAELKMMRVIRRLKENSQLLIRSTFLGAHAIPAAFKNDRAGYIRTIIDDMLPAIAHEGLADYCDVFCEQGYFTNEETDHILEAAWRYGLKPKIHVNQFTNTGGVQTGIRNHALTVDHLEVMGPDEITALQASDTLPVALPGCSYFIRIPYTPGRMLIDAGLPLVIGSDFNPGSSPSGNMGFMLSLACVNMQLTPEEALTATTINGAAAMELETITGSISKGKRAHLILTKPMRSLAEIPYYFAHPWIDRVICG